METSKICVNINLEHPDLTYKLEILKNITSSLSDSGVEYISINIDKCLGLNSSICDMFDDICRENNISWFPIIDSIRSLNFLRPYYSKWFDGTSGYSVIIPSLVSNDLNLLEAARECSDHIILYIGLSTQAQIDISIEISQPDIVVYEAYDLPKLDYITYLNHISSEFQKKYTTGFSIHSGNSSGLSIAAVTLGAKFIEYRINIPEAHADYYLNESVEFDQIFNLVNDITELDKSRGGYEAKKLNKVEKLYLKQ